MSRKLHSTGAEETDGTCQRPPKGGTQLAHLRSMKITQDVREYAAQKELDEQAALHEGMREKAEEFREGGSDIYLHA